MANSAFSAGGTPTGAPITWSGLHTFTANNPSLKAEAATPALSLKTTQSGTQEFKLAGGYQDSSSLSLVDATAATQILRFQKEANIASGETVIEVIRYHNGTTITEGAITLGAADSGGSGFKTLRVPN